MQNGWEKESIFIHVSKNDDYEKNKSFGFKSLADVIYKSKAGDVVVFHAQSALPYVVFAWFLKICLRKKITFIYDIHDLHEWRSTDSIYSRNAIRYLILGALEYIVFLVPSINKITVSNGLARLMSEKYNADAPIVVRNVSSKSGDFANNCRLRDAVVFFGTKERAPVNIFEIIKNCGIQLHLYGRDMTPEWLSGIKSNNDNIRLFGEYNPKEMEFLYKYKALILYPEGRTLNYKYSLPNKLFQALDHGVSVIAHEFFEEILELFSEAGGAVKSVNEDNIASVLVEVLEGWTSDDCKLALKIKEKIYIESKEKYLTCVGLSRGGGNS